MSSVRQIPQAASLICTEASVRLILKGLINLKVFGATFLNRGSFAHVSAAIFKQALLQQHFVTLFYVLVYAFIYRSFS